MQFQVPQFIEIEDKIVGPLTLKQFLYLGGAAVLLLFFWFLFEFFLWLLVAIPIVVLALALAFLKVNNRPFIHYIKGAIFYMLKPRIYLWERKEAEEQKEREVREEKEVEAEMPRPTPVTPARLRELANMLDTRVRVKR